MMKNYFKFLVVLVAMCIQATASAQENNYLSAAVHKAHAAGTNFQQVSLFHATTGVKHSELANENLLVPDRVSIETLYGKKPQAVTISFTDQNTNKIYALEMLRSNPLAKDANFGHIENGFRYRNNFDEGVHYQGAIAGSDKSLAAMSVFADGTVMILFANQDGNFIVGKLEDASGNYVFYNDKDMVNKPSSVCGVKDETYSVAGNDNVPQGMTTGVNLCKKVQVYWETDYQLTQFKGGLSATTSYMIGLFNQFQTMYKNENISVELKSLYVWVTDDAYPSGTSSDGLDIFKGYWNGKGDAFDGDLAHFITKDNSSNGGLAYVDVLTNRSFAYAYSEIHGNFSAVPTYSWDVMVLTHETGHNLGSRHTHWCGWMTGPGSTCGSIDDCNTKDASSGCSSCTYETLTDAAPVGAWTGTVMSYCHLKSRGINLVNGFGPLPGGVIRTNVNNGSNTLLPVISATLTPNPICPGGGGSITLNFDANNFGVAPYTYTWSGGGSGQNLTGIITPGSYGVTVVDSNGCQGVFNTTVGKAAQPGNGQVTGYTKPVCCNDSAVAITLTANVPADLSDCQTVAWLRTAGPLSTYAAAQSAFNSATTNDKIASANTASINNSTAATLTVSSPAPCALQSYYYTPFVTRKARAAINVPAASVAGSGNITQGATIQGKYVTLMDQTSSAFTPCDVTDTPVVKTLSVVVSGYTGRSNKMTMVLMNIDGIVVFRQDGLAGNGTYSIPLTNAMALQEMTVAVYDFNCTNSTSCVASTATLSVTRTVQYGAITQITFDKACTVGSSVLLAFAPADCQPKGTMSIGKNTLSETSRLNVYPNPASKSVTVQFNADASGMASVKVTDMLGKVVESRNHYYSKGDNLLVLDVHQWAKGIYTLSFSDGVSTAQNVKLVVQ